MKRNRTIPLNCSLILILIAMCLPTLVYAEYTLTIECGGGYGTRTMTFPNKSSCEAKLRETKKWLKSVGGGCTITNACTCDQSSEPTYTPPAYDYEAERRRQEEEQQRILERQRKIKEEARQSQEKFEKNKQDAFKLLKGVESSEFDLKGAATGKDLGLKGVKDAGVKDALSDVKLKGVDTLSPHLDPSVVDLRDMSDRPLVVDPRKVKGTTPKPITAETSNEFTDLQMLELLFSPPDTESKWPGPKNPYPPLINPLREPERYEAWKRTVWAKFLKTKPTLQDMETDPRLSKELNEARDEILKKEFEENVKARERSWNEMRQELEKLRKQAGLKDYAEFDRKLNADPDFSKRVMDARDRIVEKEEQAIIEARKHSFDQFLKVVNELSKSATGK